MKERAKLREWDPGWRNQTRVQIMGDSNLVVNWCNGKVQDRGTKDTESVGQKGHTADE